MSASYTYQRVVDSDIYDSLKGFGLRSKPWYRRPSILWLLPVFLLLNLAMGATSMPRMNVIISVICRNILATGIPRPPEVPSEVVMLRARHGGGMSGESMIMSNHNGTYSSSNITIGDYNPQCSIKEVESATAMFNLWGNLIAGIIAAIVTPFWGKLSDRFGRIKPLAAATTVMLFSEALMVLIAKYPDTLSLTWVYLTFVLEGLSGSFILIMALVSSYAADCTAPKDRNIALGWLHGSMFFGMAAGPALGGAIGMSGGKSEPLLIFYVGLAMRVLAILLLAIVPDSLELDDQDTRPLAKQLVNYLRESSRGSWGERLQRVSPLHLLRILTLSNTETDHSTKRNVFALASINTILFGAVMGAMNVMMLYSEFRFAWGNKESGIFLSTVNIFRTLATVLVLPLLITISRRSFEFKRSYVRQPHGHGPPDDNVSSIDSLDIFLLRASIVSDTIGYVGYALAPTGALFTLSGAIASLGAIGLATSEACMTKLLPAAQTGELLGALGLLQALARIVAPTVASLTYSWTANSMPQLVFWGIALSFVIAGCLTLLLRVETAQDGKSKLDSDEGEAMIPLETDVGKESLRE